MISPVRSHDREVSPG